MRTVLYPGSFDPITNGHIDIIERSAVIFDKVIVAVMYNMSKKPCFSPEERVELITKSTEHLTNVEVVSFSGLLVDFMESIDVDVMVKGLRAVSDFEYELSMASMNNKLNSKIETIFLPTSPQYSYLSSSLVKEVAKFKGNIDDLVPLNVKEALLNKFD